MVKSLNEQLDDKYHVAILDPKTRKVIGKEEEFQTLEEVLGFLHNFEEIKNRERILVCLMGLRDGKCEVTINRRELGIGNEILRIKPPKTFHKLFWQGFGLKFEE